MRDRGLYGRVTTGFGFNGDKDEGINDFFIHYIAANRKVGQKIQRSINVLQRRGVILAHLNNDLVVKDERGKIISINPAMPIYKVRDLKKGDTIAIFDNSGDFILRKVVECLQVVENREGERRQWRYQYVLGE